MKNAVWVILLNCLFILPGPTLAGETIADDPCFTVNPNREPETVRKACSGFIEAGTAEKRALGIAYLNRGVAQRAVEEYESSIADITIALEYLDDEPSVARMLAWTLREQGKPEKAEEIYTRILATDTHWQGWLSRCVVRLDLGKTEAALKDCNRARAQSPDNNDVLAFTASALNRLGRFEEAYETASSGFGPDDIGARLYFQAVVALWESGRHSEIPALLKEGLRHYPTDPDLVFFIRETWLGQE
jgi:tetratricopeptide (TPR) repeat protein